MRLPRQRQAGSEDCFVVPRVCIALQNKNDISPSNSRTVASLMCQGRGIESVKIATVIKYIKMSTLFSYLPRHFLMQISAQPSQNPQRQVAEHIGPQLRGTLSLLNRIE